MKIAVYSKPQKNETANIVVYKADLMVHDISVQLNAQAENVAAYLLPNGKLKNGVWRVGSVQGEEGGSMGVVLTGEKAGRWKDHQSGERGDLIDLFQLTQSLDKGAAVNAAKEFLGLQEHKPTPQLKPCPATAHQAPNMKPAPNSYSGMKKVHEWVYRTPDGKRMGCVARYEDEQGKKQVIPFFRADGKPGIPSGLDVPLYGHADPAYAFVVEGEKCVDATHQVGLPAITSQGGSGAAQKADISALKDVETIYFLPDNDESGMKYMNTMAARLKAQNPEVKLLKVELDGLPEKGDIADWIKTRIPDWNGYDPDERIAGLKGELRDRVKVAKPIEIAEPRLHDFILTFGDKVEPKPVNWMWPERFGAGFLSIIAGPGGVGKSTAAISMAAIITQGGKWPFSDDRAEQGMVAWITGEESIDQQLTPRLMVAGADLSQVIFVEGVIREEVGEEEGGAPMRMSLDAHQIPGLKRKYPNLRMVVIDPLSAFLDARDSHKEADVRQVFHPWVLAAEEAGVAVIFIAHHNKSKGGHVRDKLSGSTAIRNAVRTVYAVLENPGDEKELLFLPEKSNLSDGQVPGLVFRIVGKEWESGDASGNVACVEWCRETDQKANVVASTEHSSAHPIDDAEQFLRSELADRACFVKDLKASAMDAGLSWRTVNRAKKKLRIDVQKDGFTGGWRWRLPEECNEVAKSAKDANFSPKDASHDGWHSSGVNAANKTSETAQQSHSREGCHHPDITKDAKGVGTLRDSSEGCHSKVVRDGGNLRQENDPEKDEVGFV